MRRALPPADAARVPTSPAQLRWIRILAGRRGVDPADRLRQQGDPTRLEVTTRSQAGQLIDRVTDRRER